MACNIDVSSRFLPFKRGIMIPKKYRLKNNAAFLATYKINNFVCDSNLFLYLGKEKQDSDVPTKVGVVVSKKIHKRAVRRNRIKRLIREAYRLILKSGEADCLQNRLSVIFVGRKGALDCDFSDIKKSILKLLNKASK